MPQCDCTPEEYVMWTVGGDVHFPEQKQRKTFARLSYIKQRYNFVLYTAFWNMETKKLSWNLENSQDFHKTEFNIPPLKFND
jgi:hypothetical protein